MEIEVSRIYRCTNKVDCGIVLQLRHTPIKDKEYQYIELCPVCGGDLDYAYTEQREEFTVSLLRGVLRSKGGMQ